MQSITVTFYDGVVSKPHQARLMAVDSSHIMLQYQDAGQKKSQRFAHDQMTFIGALGGKFPVIELKNDARIELLQHDIPDWLQLKHQKFQQKIWQLERTPLLILFSVVVVMAVAASVLKWGIPLASNVIAYQLPENSLNQLGDQAESYVLKLTKPSELPENQQQQIRRQYIQQIAQGQPAKLVFREGGELGANALALPNHTIIVTDELVELAHSDQEILGVLAHEQGHLIKRHSLQQAISSLGFSVLYIAITGDSSDLFTTLPVALAGASYSRQFEKEADHYALELMQRQNIEVTHFANFLERLSEETKEEAPSKFELLRALSSHPATAERIQMVHDFEAAQQSKDHVKKQP